MNILLLIPVLPITLACVVHEEYNGFPIRNISDLGIAAIENNPVIVDDLMKSGCEVNYNGTTMYFIVYDEDANLTSIGGVIKGFTPLHLASMVDSLDFVQTILEIPGIEVDMTISDGATPLVFASRKGSMDIVRVLHYYGADVDHLDKYGRTPMYMAVVDGELDTMEALFELGANVDTSDNSGNSPVYMAAAYGYLDKVRRLHEMGANLDGVGGPHNDTTLIVAAWMGNNLIVEYLVDAGVNRNFVDNVGKSALDYAEERGFANMVDILLS